jgi:hypothetical protein
MKYVSTIVRERVELDRKERGKATAGDVTKIKVVACDSTRPIGVWGGARHLDATQMSSRKEDST